MKLVYHHPLTKEQRIECFADWHELLDQTWRVYFRLLPLSGKVNIVGEIGWEALKEVL